jgi:lipopolysaccharide transport system permease protein
MPTSEAKPAPPLLILSKNSGSWSEYLKDLFRYAQVLRFLAFKDIKVQLASTALGHGWIVLRPMLQILVLSLIFGRIVRIDTGDTPYFLFAMSGFVAWSYFSSVTARSANSLAGNAGLLTKVYFPRVYLTLSVALGGLVELFVSLALFLLISMLYYGFMPTAMLCWLPVPFLLLIMTSLGAGLWIAALSVEYRDIRLATQYVLQMMMFISPIIWPISLLLKRLGPQAEAFIDIYPYYPIAGVVEGFRAVLLGYEQMPWLFMGKSGLVSLLLLVSGFLYFRRRERLLADIV